MNIIFLGPPGSGKGTYSSRICEQRGWAHISTGDMFREEIKKETALGKQANDCIKKGELVPDDVTTAMLKTRLEQDDTTEGFILDGFPRTIHQAHALENITHIDMVIDLVIPDEIIVKKISARRTCSNCGNLYNVADIRFGEHNQHHMPPVLPKQEGVCDKCGGELIQRKDDNPEVIRERLVVYRKQTEPLIEYYKTQGLLKDVPVTGSPDVMVPKILQVLEGT